MIMFTTDLFSKELGVTSLLAQAHPLATADAILNALAGLLLVIGYIFIRRGHETAHKWTMLSAFAVSVAFLVCYSIYHFIVNSETTFSGSGIVRPFYFALLISHIALAATVPFLALFTIYFALREKRSAHRRLARWTFPIWIYVSVTGVIIYVMLYHLFP